MESFTFFLPVEVRFGRGALAELRHRIARYGWRSIWVISDPGVREAGLLDRLEELLDADGLPYRTFSGVRPNPTEETVTRALKELEELRPEAIIALGGGSTLDTAKIISVLRAHGGKVWDYQGPETVPGPALPVVAIPTTAGTGSEVTRFAVISDPKRRRKIPLTSRFLFPKLAIVDPELMVILPPKQTAATGMDALTHAIEAMTTTAEGPISDLIAVRAIELINNHLPRAFRDGADLEAREAMALAATLAGIAFGQALVALAHALAHAVGGLYDLPHGVCCALALPLAMEYNLDAKREKYEVIARALGASGPEGAVERVRELNSELKIPSGLRALGIKPTEEEIEALAQAALEDGSILFNPRPVDLEALKGLVRRLIDGS